MTCKQKKLCRYLIVLEVFVVFAFEYHILWDRFVLLTTHTDRSGVHIEPSGTKMHSEPTSITISAKEEEREFFNVGKRVLSS